MPIHITVIKQSAKETKERSNISIRTVAISITAYMIRGVTEKHFHFFFLPCFLSRRKSRTAHIMKKRISGVTF